MSIENSSTNEHTATTLILSDIHLTDIEPRDPKRPLWKCYKRKELIIDDRFKKFLEYHAEKFGPHLELVLNGDIFDFDSVMVIPKGAPFKVSILERWRGMNATELKSRAKMKVILEHHDVFVKALSEFVKKGNRVVFIIGNHDMELHWPSVQADIIQKLGLSKVEIQQVRFCEWFYISNQDTLIEHGNQYDDYCLCANPINPLIRKGRRVYVRLPFGNLANKYMLNGMGLFNPHVEGSWMKNSIWDYIVFFYRYMMRIQPFLIFQWLFGALAAFFYSLTEALLPSLSDPLTLPKRIDDVARKSNSTASVVLALKELSVHPAGLRPMKILRELWLDRVIFFSFIIFGSLQIFSLFNLFGQVSSWWFWGPVLFLLPIVIFYSHSVESEVKQVLKTSRVKIPMSAKITGVNRVIHGHTHIERHTFVNGIEHLNTGTWSATFEDIACTVPIGRKCYALIRKEEGKSTRVAELYEWQSEGPALIPPQSTSSLTFHGPQASS